LPGEMHTQFPGSLGKICQALGCDLDRSGFVIHVPVKPFTHGGRRHVRPLMHFRVAMDNMKAFFPQRVPAERHPFNLLRVFSFYLDHIALSGNRSDRSMLHDIGILCLAFRELSGPFFFGEAQLRQLFEQSLAFFLQAGKVLENALHHAYRRFVQ
jgi:hypothetical protein